MPRKPKDYKFFSIKLDRTIYERLERYCEIEDRTKTAAAERIFRQFLDDYERNNHVPLNTSESQQQE